MKTSSIVGTLLILTGFVLLSLGGYRSTEPYGRVGRLATEIDSMQVFADSVQEELFQTNLLYRGHQESMKSIPDSLKRLQSGMLMKRSKEFNKQIHRYEVQHKEVNRQIRRKTRLQDAARSDIQSSLLPFGAAGVVLLAVGLVLVVRGRNR